MYVCVLRFVVIETRSHRRKNRLILLFFTLVFCLGVFLEKQKRMPILEHGSLLSYSDRQLSGKCHRSIVSRLPLHLTVEAWKRYGYTPADVRKTLSSFSTSICWECARIVCPPKASPIKCIAYSDVTIGSKHTLINRIVSSIAGQLKSGSSILSKTVFSHIPTLPVIYVELSKFMALTEIHDEINEPSYLQANEISTFFHHNGCLYYPLLAYSNELYVTRVVSQEVFVDGLLGSPESYVNRGILFIDKKSGQAFRGTEECALFRPARGACPSLLGLEQM